MKRVIFTLLMMSALLLACSTEKETFPIETTEVSFDIDIENAPLTRAISDGTGATQLMYGVFNSTGELVIKKTVKDNITELISENGYSMSITLTKGQTYNVVFWAQNPDCDVYDVSDDMKLTIDYEGVNNDELRDAFFGTTGEFKVEGNRTITVTLKRPFAQVNVGAFPYDLEFAKEHGVNIAVSSATIQGVANQLDMLTGEASGEVEVEYSLNTIPTEDLVVDVNEDGKTEVYAYLSMSYLLASVEKTTHDMSFVFAETNGTNPIDFSDGLDYVPIQRNWRTNIVGQILTGDISFNIKIDPIYEGDILNSGGLYYNFSEDVVIKDKVFAFNTNSAVTFTSENHNLVTMDNVQFFGRVEQIAMGEYRDKGKYILFRNEMNKVVAKDMVVDHPGISCVETIDYMTPLFFLRGETTVNNCTITGTTNTAADKKDYNGNYHKVIAYDCGVPNQCKAVFNNCTIDKLFAWSHSQITLNKTTMKYIRCATHHNSDADAHLTIGSGSVIDEIVVTSTGLAKFVTIDGKKTLTADLWAPSIIIKAGATVKCLDMNGRPSIDNKGNLSVIIEEGATVGKVINNIDTIPNAPTN
ncbi:MAG: hypothetical protein IJB58_04380 [Bacteroidales bacterium]|nr:hypothetical protein [Bacteroidales bacterium]